MGHDFSFVGGEVLKSIGASWFMSYYAYDHGMKEEKSWMRVSTTSNRISTYNSSRGYHDDWVKEIKRMSINNLSKNKIGLSGSQVKALANKF